MTTALDDTREFMILFQRNGTDYERWCLGTTELSAELKSLRTLGYTITGTCDLVGMDKLINKSSKP